MTLIWACHAGLFLNSVNFIVMNIPWTRSATCIAILLLFNEGTRLFLKLFVSVDPDDLDIDVKQDISFMRSFLIAFSIGGLVITLLITLLLRLERPKFSKMAIDESNHDS